MLKDNTVGMKIKIKIKMVHCFQQMPHVYCPMRGNENENQNENENENEKLSTVSVNTSPCTIQWGHAHCLLNIFTLLQYHYKALEHMG